MSVLAPLSAGVRVALPVTIDGASPAGTSWATRPSCKVPRIRRTESGSAPLELVLMTIPVLAVMMLIVLGGRVMKADGTLDGVAHYGALQAAQARSAGDADSSAQEAVAAELAAAGLPCDSTAVVVDTGDFRPGGSVAVEVTCRLRLSDLGPLPMPGSRSTVSRSVAVVDVFRGGS